MTTKLFRNREDEGHILNLVIDILFEKVDYIVKVCIFYSLWQAS